MGASRQPTHLVGRAAALLLLGRGGLVLGGAAATHHTHTVGRHSQQGRFLHVSESQKGHALSVQFGVAPLAIQRDGCSDDGQQHDGADDSSDDAACGRTFPRETGACGGRGTGSPRQF